MTNYERLGLYPHNVRASEEVKEAFENGEDIVSIVHATGTGKSYNALALAMDNKDKRIIWVVPTNAIKEHIEKTINNNSLLNKDDDFPNLEIVTYSSLVNKTKEEIKDIPCDLLIVDELHHLGAPVWGQRINDFIDTHEDLNVFGMTAYTVRDRGTIYERDMVNSETDEIFSDSVVSNFDLYDALIEGVLPKPVVRSVITENNEIIKEIRDSIELLKKKGDTKYQEYEQRLNDTVKIIHKQPGVKELVQQSVKPGGKYIYFCPVVKEEGVNDIPTIQNKMMEYLKEKFPNQKIVFYSSTSKDGELGRKNRDSFYHDVDLVGNDCQDAIRIMFAINQYNEGVHAPNVDGVFLGRTTSSDIVAFEQIGRALSVRGDNYQELEKYRRLSLEELRNLATSRGLPVEENHNKEQIIDLLVSPLIIDLANNMEFIEELETNLGTRLKEARQEQSTGQKRLIKITDSSLNHQVINRSILEILKNMRENLRTMTWEDKFNLLKVYYNHHGDSNVPRSFKTINGYEYDENGSSLGNWVTDQRERYKKGKLSKERIQKLSEVDFVYDIYDYNWNEMFEVLKKYYEENGHSNVPSGFKTSDGYALGNWVNIQRKGYKIGKLSKERILKLSTVNFEYAPRKRLEQEWKERWNEMFEMLKKYYEENGHSNVPIVFKTDDGYELGVWVSNQRTDYKSGKLSEECIAKLAEVNFEYNFHKKDIEERWNIKFEMLKKYYEENGHSNVPDDFKTSDGYALGNWVSDQRKDYKSGKLSEERIAKLATVNFEYTPRERLEQEQKERWNEMFELLKKYYEENGHSNVPASFKTSDGYALGDWVNKQRKYYKSGKLSEERIAKLATVNFEYTPRERLEQEQKERWNEMFELLKKYYEENGHSNVPASFKTSDGYALGDWASDQRVMYKSGKLSEEWIVKLSTVNFVYDIYDYNWNEMFEVLKKYYEENGHSNVPAGFKTSDGYALGNWLNDQRTSYKKGSLSEERIKKLDLLGVRFVVKKEHTAKLIELCNQYGLNYEKHKILSKMSYQELYAKIEFLLENNIPLEINGELNPIFGMSNENMKVIHGISKEELISNYYINNQNRGR